MPPAPGPIRNLGVVAHVDAGKTTLAERMLFLSGSIRVLGSVDRGTTHTDWLDVERERGISVRAATATFPWRGVAVNLIDTPGHADFSAEVERSLRVLDGAVLVLSAVEGIQAQTAVLWKALRALGIPTLLFINKTDRVGADPDRVLAELHRQFSPMALPLPETDAVPSAELLERLAEHDDLLLEPWLEGRPVPPALLRERMAALVQAGTLFPVLIGSASRGEGVERLLDAVVEYLPAPGGDPDGPVSGVVFKLEHDKTMGRVAFVRLFSGTVRNRDTVANTTQGAQEKITQMEVLASLLRTRFGLEATFGSPSVIYRETPARAGEGFIEYTMPKPCWAVLRFAIEPGEPGSGLQYRSVVRDDDLLYRYQNQVQRTLPEALKQGLHGWEVTDLRITLVAGQHHLVHTHPLDFAVATPMGIMDGLEATGTTLLEPMLDCAIAVPAALGNRIIGDILQMRGTFESPEIAGDTFRIQARVPVATSLDYPTRLGSLTGGRGVLSTVFAGYQECLLELGATCPRRGIDPRDHAKYILGARKAL